MEQRAFIKFNAKLGRIYGTLCLSKSNVFIWHKRFSDGRNTLENDKHTGRPSSSKTPECIEKVREFVAGITGEYYLKRFETIHRIRPEYRDEDSWCLLHDNAPRHSSLIVRRFLAKNNVCVLNHPPYSPDLAPCDFYLFPKIKLRNTDTVCVCSKSAHKLGIPREMCTQRMCSITVAFSIVR
ncbi:hypothetical protein LAZ67_6000635 [Cordylochernes scorpioides]|uniref:Transposase n=1 Tax=Cordylochernes scorpioides TaxID=51811 RepID=A0ABY6KIV1_9ARAC|nr:hypothetical protein LAZ67_6000635 [Cordylochernes scorpioides]